MQSLLLLILFIWHGGNADVIRTSKAVEHAMDGNQITFGSAGVGIEETDHLKRLIDTKTLTEVNVEENWDTNELSFSWNAEYFAKSFDSTQNYVIQFIVYVSKGFEPRFTVSQIVQLVGSNRGSATISVSAPNLERFSNIRYPYFYALKVVGTKSSTYLSSVLFAPTLGMTDILARETCHTWNKFAKTPNLAEILPCPHCLFQAEIDAKFVQTKQNPQIIKMANGELNDHVLFYEQVSTRTEHAQTCSYNSSTRSLASISPDSSPTQAGWLNYVNKFSSYMDNFYADVWPYIVCCLQSNSQEYCDLFHVKRPIDTGHGHSVDIEPDCTWTCTTCLQTMEHVLSRDPSDCKKFFLCSFGERTSLQCPFSTTFNPDTLTCTSDYVCHDPPGC